MAQDENKRQKALQKKKKKDKARKKATQAASMAGIVSADMLIRSAWRYPIFECLVNDNWQNQGLANIFLSRRKTDGNYIIGVYLTDVFCLGLKNTFCNAHLSPEQYEHFKSTLRREAPLIPCEPLLALAIIYGAIDYAKQWGFKPQKDFALSQFVLDELPAGAPEHSVTFGKNGKPCFIAGPDDDVDFILRILKINPGDGKFDFIAYAG